MSFRKKNISILPTRGPGAPPPSATDVDPAINTPTATSSPIPSTKPDTTTTTTTPPPVPTPPGVRPSPISGHPTTSTGTPSLDALLSGHAGLPLGSSVVIEESGTTDFGGALLRYYAAEGIVQGHHVIVVGMGEGWARELPQAVGGVEQDAGAGGEKEGRKERERMKIAWRYERLAAGGAGAGGLGGGGKRSVGGGVGLSGQEPETGTTGVAGSNAAEKPQSQATPFCHSFDLTKRLELTPDTKITYIPLSISTSTSLTSPFTPILSKVHTILTTQPPTTITRLIIPSLLSPALYPPHASSPTLLLQFIHSLRSLLRTNHTTLTAMLSLPLELYPRATGLVRWIEILSDAVVELVPVASLMERAARAAAKGREDMPMGLVRVWKIPDRRVGGGGGGGVMEDLAFTVTRRRFGIGLFSLMPEEEGEDRLGGEGEGGGPGKTKVDIEF